ncbi:MAG: mechanosensitive ion channel [Saprospiraceae bacterium]|nr:mechanosensitive ion channel [Saprospiraceae bacterium]MCB0543155.1 mechanosensitive ion channel [Saprospiraceae bacterium]MCB0577494.1 mechanosensitive ion channel [Saprospiraceae bacterium]MCB9306916.1 mechanosensitive ion channel [Lewinellaceae bacterium]MCB9354290.1 mechanosensitive ion channel [Lewinellaceae bacterium]
MEQKTYIDRLTDLVMAYGPKVVAALLLLAVGLWIIRRISSAFQVFLKSRNVDDSLRPFLVSMTDVALKVALLLVVAGQLGIETTSFIAVFSAVAFAVGLALQGSLGNFASGVLILLFKPYKVGDLLSVEDKIGYVTEIQIFNTVLTTEHGKKIIIPNGKITEGPIENIARDAEIQVEVGVLLASDTNLALVREAVDAAAQRCPWRIAELPSEVVVMGISRDDMKADIAWWTLGEHYILTLDFIHEALREEFAARGISMAKERRREMIE